MKRLAAAMVLPASFLIACHGCGGQAAKTPPLAQVTGTVTLDGRPLAEARVDFEPKASAATAHGLTDASGKYTLYYTQGVKGAAIGPHVVRIEASPMPDASGKMPAQVPAKYNMNSTLTAEVKAGDNTFDFPLTSK